MTTPAEFTVSAGILRAANTLMTPAFLWVREGRVAYVGQRPPESIDPAIPAYACGALVEPLYDAHVHLFLTGSHDREERRVAAALDKEDALARILALLEGYRSRGVAGVRDGGDPGGLALAAAKVAKAQPGRYAQVFPSGEPLYKRGGYGSFLGGGAADLEEAHELVRKNAKAGATQIKVLATGLNSLETAGKVGGHRFTAGEMLALAQFAEGEGLRLMVHSNGPSAASILASPASLEHGFWMEEGDSGLLAAAGVLWNPTLTAWSSILGDPALSEHSREVVRATDARQKDAVALGLAVKARIGAGSDAGTPGVAHEGGLVAELKALAGAGLGAAGALDASTREAGALLCPQGREGLGGGGSAGFIMLDGDPAVDLSFLERPVGVYLGRTLTMPHVHGTR